MKALLIIIGFFFGFRAIGDVIYVNHAASGGNDGNTWESAYTDLGTALANSAVGDHLWVAAGGYTPGIDNSFAPKQDQALYGGFLGNETHIDQRNQTTTLDGASTDIVVDINGVTGVVIDGFTIRGGTLNGVRVQDSDNSVVIRNCTLVDNGDNGRSPSAAIWCLSSSPVIRDCLIANNRSSTRAGGVSVEGNDNGPTLQNCELSNNAGSKGGGMYLGIGAVAKIEDCTFTSNSAGANKGGGIYLDAGSNLATTVSGCTFDVNSADWGGGIYLENNSRLNLVDTRFINHNSLVGGGLLLSASSANVVGCEFRSNSAQDGGAIYTEFEVALAIADSVFAGNMATSPGGAIMFNGGGNLSIDRCDFDGNSSGSTGGAIFLTYQGVITIANTLFRNNATPEFGGALGTAPSFQGSFMMTNCTLAKNSASFGGALSLDVNPIGGNATIGNSIFVGNTNVAIHRSLTSISHCLFSNNPDGDYLSIDQVYTGAAALNALPECDNIIDDPPDFDTAFRLLAGSPGVDVGDDAAQPPEATDLEGKPRFNDRIDMGAYEYHAYGPIIYVDHAATGHNNGRTWTDAFVSLHDSLAIAGAGQAVHIATGDYTATTSFRPAGGVTVLGGFGGETRLLPGQAFSVTLEITNDSVTLDSITFTGVTAGGVVLSIQGAADPLVQNCRFVDNVTASGAIELYNSSLTLLDSVFERNSQSDSASGGAVNCLVNATLEARGCTFRDNSGTNSGGAIYAERDLLLADCEFSGNDAPDGGAVHVFGPNNIIRDCTFDSQQTRAIYGQSTGELRLENCLFDGGTGAVYNTGLAITIRSCELRNHSDAVLLNQAGSLDIANSIFHHNSGSHVLDNHAVASLVNCSIANNTGTGAVLANTGTLFLSNSILWSNAGPVTDAPHAGSHNIIDTPDPRFWDPDNGDYHLFYDSPAFDAGIADAIPLDVTEDFEGNARIRNLYVDIGAYEADPLTHGVAIDGAVWHDINGDGERNVGEDGIGGVTVQLRNTLHSTTTAADGRYLLRPAPGSYTLHVSAPQNYSYGPEGPSSLIDPVTGDLDVLLSIGGPITVDAGLVRNPSTFYVDDSATGNNNGSSWTDAFTTLQPALDQAIAGDNIHIAAGDYPLTAGSFALKNGVTILGGFPDGGGARDPAANIATLDAGGADHVFDNSNLDASAVLDGVTITGAVDTAVVNNQASPSFIDCRFVNNQARFVGGAVDNHGSSPSFTRCHFVGNSAIIAGGAISGSTSPINLRNCVFEDNSAGSRGGAITNSSATTRVSGCLFVGNQATEGGAIFNEGDLITIAKIDIVNCTFADNDSAIHNRGGTLALVNSILWGNTGDPLTDEGAPGSVAASYNIIEDSDPLFADPATGDYRLFPGSPAFDVGRNATVPDDLTEDLDGNPRIRNGYVDLGAYEADPVTHGVAIDGTVWLDINVDGERNVGEDGIAGIDIQLHTSPATAPVYSTKTESDGSYVLHPAPGSYLLRLVTRGYTITIPGPNNLFDQETAEFEATVDIGGPITVDAGLVALDNVVYVDHTATGSNTGTSWDDAFVGLQPALARALPGAQVWVAAGSYSNPPRGAASTHFYVGSEVSVYGGFEGLETSPDQRSPGHETILQGDHAHRLVSIPYSDWLVFDSLTLRDGGYSDGGAMATRGSIEMRNCKILSSQAFWGGGIYVTQTAQLLAQDCLFQGNTGSDIHAGTEGAAVRALNHATFIRCQFVGNDIDNTGAAIFFERPNTGVLNVLNCQFQSNTADVSGGAVYFSGKTATIANSIFETNQGPSVIEIAAGQADIVNNTFVANGGDSIRVAPGATGSIANSIFSEAVGWAVTGPLAPSYSCFHQNGIAYHDGSRSYTVPEIPAPGNIDASPSFAIGWALASDSPCIDAGDNASLPADSADLDADGDSDEPLPLDAFSDPRIKDGTVDMGVYEYPTLLTGIIYVDHAATGDNNGSSWVDAFVSLDDALAIAVSGQAVHIADGDYSPADSFRPATGVSLLGGFGGETRLLSSGQNTMVLEGTAGSSLEQLTFADVDGANHALWLRNPTAADSLVSLCRFVDNTTEFGAIGITNGHLTVRESSFENNTNNIGSGGAINCQAQATVTVEDCEFRNNRATNSGGAIFSEWGVHVEGSSFIGNESTEGGAIHLDRDQQSVLRDCEFTGNAAWGGEGDAILCGRQQGELQLQDCLFEGNNPENSWAAIFNDGYTLTILTCEFRNHGPAFVLQNNVGEVAIANSLFHGNTGPQVVSSDADLTLTNCTLAGNSGNSVIYNNGTLTLKNAIIWGNTVSGPPIAGSGTVDHSIVQGGYPGDGNLDQKPLFADSANDDYRPLPGSPSIDSGVPDAMLAETDLDGNPRVSGASVDRGAYELQAPLIEAFVDSGQQLGHAGSTGVALSYLNGDDALDVFIAARDSQADSGANEVWLNNGDAVFTDTGQRLAEENSVDAGIGDLNGDGHLDVFVANDHESASGAANRVWFGDGTGTLVDSGQRLAAAESYDVELGDINGDGHLDAVVVNGVLQSAGTGANELWINDGTGSFTLEQTFGNSESFGVSLADLDGDGDLDVFVANINYPDTVWRNDAGTLIDTGQRLHDGISRDVALGDVDGDGLVDAVIAVGGNAPNQVWINQGNAVFANSGQSIGSSDSFAVQLGDLNGDTTLDAFFGNAHTQPDTIWYNDGAGHFTDSGQRIGAGWTNDIGLGDLDGDGDLDAYLARGATGGEPDEVWLNTWPRAVFVDHEAPGPVHDGLSWATAHLTVEDALADPRVAGLPVWVAEGVYTAPPSSYRLTGQVAIHGGFAGTEATLDQRQGGPVILDGNSAEPVVHVEVDADVHLDQLTVQGGSNGITCTNSANLRIVDTQVSGNSGIGADLGGATGQMIRSTFSANDGGGLISSGSLHIRDCTITANGGLAGLSITGGSPMIENTVISGNVAAHGGVVCQGGANASFANCAIADNAADSAGGGADVLGDSLLTTAQFANTVFSGNQPHAVGEADVMARAILQSCLFYENGADFFEADSMRAYSGESPIGSGLAAVNLSTGGDAIGNFYGTPQFVQGPEGQWSAPPAFADNRTVFTIAGDYLAPQQLAGRLLSVDATTAYIVDNNAATITVVGDYSGAAVGDSFAVLGYQLDAGSEALDSAAADYAPDLDFLGGPRVDDPAEDRGSGTPPYVDIGPFERDADALAGLPDLAITAPDVAIDGQFVQVTVHNPSAVDVPAVLVWAHGPDGSDAYSAPIAVSAGSQTLATLDFGTPTNVPVQLTVVVDPFQSVAETNESNNRVLRVAGDAILKVSASATSPIKVGDKAVVSGRAWYDLAPDATGDEVWAQGSHITLEAGGTVLVTTHTTINGSYSLKYTPPTAGVHDFTIVVTDSVLTGSTPVQIEVNDRLDAYVYSEDILPTSSDFVASFHGKTTNTRAIPGTGQVRLLLADANPVELASGPLNLPVGGSSDISGTWAAPGGPVVLEADFDATDLDDNPYNDVATRAYDATGDEGRLALTREPPATLARNTQSHFRGHALYTLDGRLSGYPMKGALLSTFSATNLDTGAIIDLSGTRPQHSSTTGGFIAYFSISPPGPYRIDLAYTDGLVTAAYSTQLEITGTYNAILHSKDLAWPEALEATIHASRHNHVDLDTIRARFTLIDIAGQGNLVCDQVQLSPIPPRESRTASCASENTGEYRVLEVDLGDWTDDNNHNNIATRAFEPPPAVTLDLAMTPIPSPLTAHHKVTRTVTATYSAPDHPVKGAEAIIKLFTPDGALLSTSTTAYTAPDGSVQLAFRVPRAAGLYGWQIEVTDSTLTGILSGDFNVHVRDAYIEHDHITLPVAPQLGEPVELRAEIHATTNSELLTNIPFGFAVTWYERNVDPPALQSEYLTPYLTVDALAPGAASESLTAMWTPPAGGPSTYVVIGAIGGHEDDPNAPGWRDDNPGNDQATQALLYGDHLRVTFADPQVAVFPPGITSLIPIEVAAVDGSPLVPDDLASFELIFSGAHEATYDLLPHYDPGLQQYVFAFQPPLDSYGELSIYAAALAHNGIDGLAARGGVIADSDVVYVDHSAPGPHNGSSWTSAWLTIEDALADPRSAIAPIHVADGDYTPPNSLRPTTGVTIRGGFGGETRLLANGPVAILELEGLPGVTLEQLTFTGVNGAYSALSVYDPTAADTLIDRCRFVDNDAEYGAITIRNGHLTIRDSYFENNNSNFGSGGAVNAQFRANSTMELTGCEFRNNTATNSGGAIYAEGGTLLVDCTFTGNSSDDGGAIHFDAGSNTIRNCQFVANSATSHGSALFLGGQSGNLLLEGSLFDANSGNQAIANFGFGATVRSCEFRNHADVLWFNESGRLDMANSIVHHNSGPVLDNQGDVEIVNCTIANNGDVLVNLAALKLYNSILWGNTGTPILGEYSGSHNIIEDADPRFRDPANGDYHLEPGLFDGNPAFDAGNNDEVPPDVSEDFEGNPRIRNVYVDIGAYEADPLAHGLVISGLITFDENGDATPNPNEVGMPDISLELRRARLVDGVVVADELDARYNTLTDDDGNYAIIVPPGIYTLRVVIPRGFTTQYSPYSVFDELTAEDSIFAEAPGTYIGNGSLAALGDIVYVTQRIVPLGFFTGTSWRNAFPNLEVALQRVPIGGSIWISEATYSNPPAENDPRTSHYYTDSVSIYGGFRGDETSLDQRPADAETILSGDDGGHRVLFIRQGDPVLLDRLTIRDGGGSDGGAIHTRSDLELRDCRIVDNQAGIGGGVYVTEIANLLATGCVFEGNTVSTDTGAAIYARGDRTTIVNSLFHGHQGSSVIHIAAGVADFANNTLAVNEGDALVLGATATGAIANSIFSDSAGTAVTGPVAPAFSCFFGNSGDYQPGLPASNLSADPRLSPDFMLFADSPCIDAGDNAALDPVWTTDLVGEPRIVNGTIDIGATEHNPRSIYVDDTATGNNDGSSWTDAFTDLQDGLGVADPGDSIHIAAGSYVSTAVSYQLESGVTVLGGYPDGGGARDPATYLTQLGPDGTNPIIHHSGRDIDNSAILDGVTLSGALNGAVRNGDASPTFRNCTFSNNRISGDGGAFHNGGGSPTFVDCRFANNVADGAFGRGGAIFNDGNMTITRCQFQGNEATDSAGAIYVLGVLTITDGDFQTNRATHGGGALSLELLEGENVSVIGCTFDGNTVSGSGQLRGGGAIESWPGSPTITNCIFANNSVVEGGGAIFNADFGPTFDANPAITNCLFYGNSAGSGAAFYNRGPGVSPTLTNCTFTRNSATISGGALHNDGGTPLLTNAIIWANSAPADPQIAGDTVSVAHSIVEGGYPGTGNLDLDPLFGDGYRPRPGSPAIDSGESVALPATDLDGNPRVVGAGVDRGAYELQVDIPPELFVDSGERIGSAASFAVALGRLDGDDNLDAFIATRRSHLDSGANLVWLGNGDASFTDSGQRLGFQNSGSVALGYINDDPYLDAAIANDHESARGAANRVWWGNADGSFTDSGARFGSAETSEVALADLDGDGDLDLLFANGIQQGVDSGANEIWLYEDGGFISGGSFGPAESTGIAAAGNIVFVTNANQTDTIWEIVGDGTLRLAGQTSAANNSQDVALADLNGDGHLDAFVTNGSNQPDYVYFNQGGFDFQDSGQRLGNTYSRAVALGDLNGDGFLDAFVASIDNKPDTIWYNDGSGHFYDSGQRLNPGWSWDVALGDLDGDGDLDAYLAKGNTGGGADEVWINTWPRAVHVDREAPGPIHDGLSWATAYRSIPEGVNDSRAVATPIHVADGSYTDHVIVADDRHIVGGFGGDTVITVVDDLGAILVQAGRLTVRDLIFDRCRAELGSGGALNSLIHGSLDVANCEFRNGFATNDGGAIHTEGGENSVRHSIFVGNESVAGSAIGVYGGQLNLRHCELRNHVGHNVIDVPSGGANIVNCLFVDNQGNPVHAGVQTEIVNSTFSGNQLGLFGQLTLRNSILWGNGGLPLDGNVTVSHSIVEDIDPLFENGYHPATDSPAIDAGGDFLPADLRVDLDGLPRRIGPVDLGVYEASSDCDGAYTLFRKTGAAGSHFGHAIAPDGQGNFIVGARGTSGAGEVVVYSGYDGHILHHLVGNTDGARFGCAVAGNAELIVVGEPQASKVYLYAADTGEPIRELSEAVTQFGLSLALVDDSIVVSGDGVVFRYDLDGSPIDSISRGGDFGYAVVSLGDGRYGVSAMQADRVSIYADGDLLFELRGQAGEWFGRSLAAAGDADNDGVGDVLVGSSIGDTAYLYSGATGELLHSAPGGIAVASAGDANHDGYADFAATTGIYSGFDGSLLHGFDAPVTTLANLGFGLAIGDYQAGTCEVRKLAACAPPPVIAQGFAISASTDEDVETEIALDISGQNPVAEISHGPSHGRVELATFDYGPLRDYNGEDRFYVRVTDDGGEVAVTEVIVTVNPINDPPELVTPPSFDTPIFAGDLVQPVAGIWTDARDLAPGQITLSFQWLSADSASGDNPTPIPGATSLDYQTSQDDGNRWLALEVTAIDDGEGLPASASSVATTEFAYVVLPLDVGFVHPPTHLPVPVAEGGSKAFEAEVGGGVAPYVYTWTIDDVPVSSEVRNFSYEPDHVVVVHPNFSRDVTLVCRVTDSGGIASLEFVWTVRVGDVDRLPPAPEISILPVTPGTLDTLSLNIVADPVDPDGDVIVGYDISWRLIGASRDAFTGPTLDWRNTAKGQAWRAAALPLTQPYGGLEYSGHDSGEATTFIHNTAPTAVHIGPIAVADGTPVEIQLIGDDPDVRDGTDSLQYEIVTPPQGSLVALNPDGLVRYTPAGVADSFTYRVRDNESAESAAATVDLDVAGWSLSIDVTNGELDNLLLGVHPNPPPNIAIGPQLVQGALAAFEDSGELLRAQYRAEAPGAEWTLLVDAREAEAPVLLSWDGTNLPLEGLYLDEPGGNLVIDMAERNSVTVEAGELRSFRVRYARVAFTMTFARGWNLISLPIVPVENQLDILFPAPLDTGLVFGGNELTTTKLAEVGRVYWVHNDGPPLDVTFEGSKAPPEFWQTELLLIDAWNPFHVVGSPPWAPRRRADVIYAEGRIISVLGWHPSIERWRPGPLLPGRGYLGYVRAP